jgi:Sortase domain
VTPAHRGPARRGRLAAVLAGGAAVCLAAGAHLLTQPARADVADAGTVPVQAPAPSVAPPVQEVPPSRARITRSTPQTLPPLVLPPVAFAAPDLHARARVVPVGTDTGGALELPDDPRTLGWWVGGAVPGAVRGTVIVAGHIDTKEGGAGVMAGVIRLPIGARVSLTDAAGAQRMYRVVAVRSYPKRALPARLFTGATTARLVLVTCGGTFDAAAHHYSDNIVVYAVPVDA